MICGVVRDGLASYDHRLPRRRKAGVNHQLKNRSLFKGLPEPLAVSDLGQRLTPFLALISNLGRIAKWDNRQQIQLSRDT